jgi:hypothetical protein
VTPGIAGREGWSPSSSHQVAAERGRSGRLSGSHAPRAADRERRCRSPPGADVDPYLAAAAMRSRPRDGSRSMASALRGCSWHTSHSQACMVSSAMPRFDHAWLRPSSGQVIAGAPDRGYFGDSWGAPGAPDRGRICGRTGSGLLWRLLACPGFGRISHMSGRNPDTSTGSQRIHIPQRQPRSGHPRSGQAHPPKAISVGGSAPSWDGTATGLADVGNRPCNRYLYASAPGACYVTSRSRPHPARGRPIWISDPVHVLNCSRGFT